MSLGWLRFFGTSVNKEERENSCGLRAEKFFARIKHSSSRLHSSWSKDNVLPVNHANDVGRVQEIRKIRIFGTCRILDWMRKFNFLDDEKVKWEEGKIEAGHRTSLLHNIFLRIFIQMFLLVYSTIKIRDTQRLPLHLQPWKDQLKSFQYCLWRLQSQLVILHCKMLVERKR